MFQSHRDSRWLALTELANTLRAARAAPAAAVALLAAAATLKIAKAA